MNPIVYCLHLKLLKYADRFGYISREKVLGILGERLHAPKDIREAIIIELKNQKVILESGKGYYIINRAVAS